MAPIKGIDDDMNEMPEDDLFSASANVFNMPDEELIITREKSVEVSEDVSDSSEEDVIVEEKPRKTSRKKSLKAKVDDALEETDDEDSDEK